MYNINTTCPASRLHATHPCPVTSCVNLLETLADTKLNFIYNFLVLKDFLQAETLNMIFISHSYRHAVQSSAKPPPKLSEVPFFRSFEFENKGFNNLAIFVLHEKFNKVSPFKLGNLFHKENRVTCGL